MNHNAETRKTGCPDPDRQPDTGNAALRHIRSLPTRPDTTAIRSPAPVLCNHMDFEKIPGLKQILQIF